MLLVMEALMYVTQQAKLVHPEEGHTACFQEMVASVRDMLEVMVHVARLTVQKAKINFKSKLIIGRKWV